MAEDLDNIIQQIAEGPELVEVDGVWVKQQPLPHVVDAGKYMGAKAAGKNPAKALVRMKIVPSGTV
jgi:hypothetical protein